MTEQFSIVRELMDRFESTRPYTPEPETITYELKDFKRVIGKPKKLPDEIWMQNYDENDFAFWYSDKHIKNCNFFFSYFFERVDGSFRCYMGHALFETNNLKLMIDFINECWENDGDFKPYIEGIWKGKRNKIKS